MQTALNLPNPPPELVKLSHTLGERIVDWIEDNGPMPFDQYMRMCLYEPGLGYYTNGLHKFGASGDFVTAPEQGDLFAQALARQIDQVSAQWGEEWVLLELGAGSGVLAKDLLNHLNHRPARYEILEPSAALRAVQAETLAGSAHQNCISWINEPPSAPFKGLILANEVIDALPVKRFRVTPNGIDELAVHLARDRDTARLSWTAVAPDQRLVAAVSSLKETVADPLPVGFESELCVDVPSWLAEMTRGLAHGMAWFIDYGYATNTYYHPDRDTGTLVCHYRHRAHFDPFIWPGLTDLSAFVDFGLLERAASSAGLAQVGFTSQAEFVLAMGMHEAVWAQTHEHTRLQQLAELKRLTLPGEMGEKFKLMALARGDHAALHGFCGSMLP